MEICNKKENMNRRFNAAFELGAVNKLIIEKCERFSDVFFNEVMSLSSNFLVFIEEMSDDTALSDYVCLAKRRLNTLKDIAIADKSMVEIESVEHLDKVARWLSFVYTIREE